MVFEWYYVVLRCSPAPHKVLYNTGSQGVVKRSLSGAR